MPENPSAAEDELDPTRDLARASWDAVTPVYGALAALFICYLGFNFLRAPWAMSVDVIAVQVLTIAWCAALGLLARGSMPAPWLAQASGISIALVAATCSAVVGRAAGDHLGVGVLGVPIVGVFSLVLATGWALLAAALVTLLNLALPPRDVPLLEVFVILLTSAIVGLAVHIARRHTHRRVRELRARDRAAQQERLTATARLAGGLGHDFNNLLNVIQGETMLLSADDLSAEERATAIASLEETIGRAAELTRQLLAFSRQQLVTPTRVAPMHELGKLERSIRRTLPSTIDVEVGCDAASGMVIDAGQLGQAVLNLAINARDAMPEGGTLKLRASDVQVDSVQRVDPPGQLSSARRPGSYVAISVEDTGSGMDDETLSHLFEPFFTTKAAGRGTGLGLSMVHGIVHQHGGFVEVQSRVGRGTRFTLFVPAA